MTPERGEAALILALARGERIERAAKLAGVSARTVYRRLADPTFRGEVSRRRDLLIGSAVGKLADVAAEAVEVLAKLMRSAKSEAVKLQAARAILAHVRPIGEYGEVTDRLEEVEQELERQNGHHPRSYRFS